MPKPVFTWFPDVGASCSTKPNVQPTKFGDGYELRVPTSINTNVEKWSVKFTRVQSISKQIDDFLRALKGSQPFIWKTPEENEMTFICREWRKNRLAGGVTEITGEFEQVFDQ